MIDDLGLIENPYASLEDKADVHIPTATLQVYNFINAYLGRKEGEGGAQRGSAATMCVKRRWFQHHGHTGDPLTPRKLVNFLLGDLSEKALNYFVEQGCVGPGKLYSEVSFGDVQGVIQFQGKDLKLYKQKDLTLEVKNGSKPLKIICHADGFGKRNLDGKWELIEFKSAANWGYADFQENGAGDYLKQSHALMQTNECRSLGIESVRFFYLRKETGHVWDRVHNFDPSIAKIVLDEFRAVESEMMPDTPHALIEETVRKKPTGRKIAEFPCSYCPFIGKCHGPYSKEWKADQFGHQKPVYVFEENENEIRRKPA